MDATLEQPTSVQQIQTTTIQEVQTTIVIQEQQPQQQQQPTQQLQIQEQQFQQTIFQYTPKPATSQHTTNNNNKWTQRPHHSSSPYQNHHTYNNSNNHYQNNQNHYNHNNQSYSPQNNHQNYQNNTQNNYNQNQGQQKNQKQAAWAANLLGCEAADVNLFDDFDPLNPSNRVSGYVCKKTDKLLIMGVNAPLSAPVILLSSPAPTPAFKGNTFIPTGHNFKKYFISYKWNGAQVTVYKYHDQEGNIFISARPRGFAFLRDTEYVKYLSTFTDCLSKLEPPVSIPLKMDNLPPFFDQLNFDIQSISCELFGVNMPHLIKYPFDIRLKTLYYTHNEGGSISPISDVEEGLVVTPTDSEEIIAESLATAVEAGLGLYCGPIDITDSNPSLLENLCRLLTQQAYRMNDAHRKNTGFPDGACNFDNFLVEGWVLHLLDEEGLTVDRMFLLQPDDIKQTHWNFFDAAAQQKTLVALRDLRMRSKANVSPGEVKRELGLSHYQWVKWGRDIMGLMDGIPAPLNVTQRPPTAQRMILLVGIPGSGKSTLSRQLVGKGWERCNQDELGNRKLVEQMVGNHLRDGKNVIVDRCNFDILQRHTWVKLASQFGIKWITCIILRTDPEVCKQRVSVREGHQTIPTGEQGFAIIDRFKDLWVEPHVAEGFCEILEIRSDLEMETNVQKLIIRHLENQVDSMGARLQQLQKRIRELESEKAAKADHVMIDNTYQVLN